MRGTGEQGKRASEGNICKVRGSGADVGKQVEAEEGRQWKP